MTESSSSLAQGRRFRPDARRVDSRCGGSVGSVGDSDGMSRLWAADPTGSEKSSLRFLEAELDSLELVGVVFAAFPLDALRGVDSSSGRAKLSSVRPMLEPSASEACRILCCRLLGRMLSSIEFSLEDVG